ncbi:aminopeptidase N [Halorhodospira halophila]|nr:aminopeptidase N [Halorhodospira halophila]MBK1728572.1 aminopeptidase N [Halorhodospira halophila]
MSASRPQTIRLRDYQPPAFLVERIHLRVDLSGGTAQVDATLDLHRNPAADNDAPLRLDAEFLDLESLTLDGAELEPSTLRDEQGTIVLHDVPQRCRVESVSRFDPAANTALSGLYRSGGMFCTQCEAEGFRRITPYPDRPDVLAPFTTTVVADRATCPVLLSNGDCIDRGALDAERHYAVWHDPFPKPSYLFALVAGDLACQEATFVTASGREVALHFYVEPENAGRTEHALAALQRAMRWDETHYGLEYDLDTYMVVAVGDFNMGAMENKGLNVFNTQFVLASPDTATDADYENIEAVIGHEYFHNWTGNRVTCRDWFQLSLKEGLTVFREHQFAEAMGSEAVQRIGQVRLLRTAQFPEDAGPMSHPVRPDSYVEINNFYTATVYAKGAEVIRMYHTLLGDDAFRRGVQRYLQRHDGEAATIEDFLAAMEEAGGLDLQQFALWYTQAGTPRIEVEDHYDAEHNTYTLICRQSLPASPGQPHKDPMHIPLAVGLLGRDGRPLAARRPDESTAHAHTRVLELREPEQHFVFEQCPERPVPSLLRGFSAPVKLHYPYTDDDLGFLLAHDSDPFARWEAGQQLALRVLLDEAQGTPRPDGIERLEEAFRASLEAPDTDPALVAEALTLPGETYLAEQMDVVDPQAIHDARQRVRAILGEALEGHWLILHSQHSGPWHYEPDEVARRRLRNLALGYLNAGSERHLSRALEQLERSDNLTDRLAALAVLADSPRAEAEQAVDAFYQRWSDEPLVVDKWFRTQALADRPDTVYRVHQLTEHPDFTLDNPNRARALLGAFAQGNPAHFHSPDGSGYRLLGEHVLRLDPNNPQLAARLLAPLAQWRRYNASRRHAMREQLERILERDALSKDVYEVASKSLGAMS